MKKLIFTIAILTVLSISNCFATNFRLNSRDIANESTTYYCPSIGVQTLALSYNAPPGVIDFYINGTFHITATSFLYNICATGIDVVTAYQGGTFLCRASFTRYPLPTITSDTTVNEGTPIKLYCNHVIIAGATNTYAWTGPGAILAGTANKRIAQINPATLSSAGTYTVSVYWVPILSSPSFQCHSVLTTNVTVIPLGTSIKESSQTPVLTVYPNPATNNITVSAGNLFNIYDISGKLVLSSTDRNINLESLTAGTYILNVDNTNRFKLVKQ